MKNLKIDKNNYEGYIELFHSRMVNNAKIFFIRPLLISTVFMVLTTYTSLYNINFINKILNSEGLTHSLSILGIIGLIELGSYSASKIKAKKNLKKILKKYPYLDTNFDNKQLKKSLNKVGIEFSREKLGINDDFEVYGVEKYLKKVYKQELKKQVKKTTISKVNYTEPTYPNLLSDFGIDDCEMEKVKVLIRKMK